ncbi:MAG: SDR family oxidoreductase, partial [Chitinophagaceae bacterium]|nr:SDR family oxidoreductase [Rubrivivax sp.]
VVLVVGAGSGIGAATARLASALGADVLLAGRSVASLEATRSTLAAPDRARLVPFDYLDETQVADAVASFGTVHHVVIPAVADENAKRGKFVEMPLATMRSSFDKFWGSVNVLRAVAPLMPAGGSATLFASIAGLKPTPASSGLSVMNGVQAAVIQLGRSLALELAPRRVNVIAPGAVLTNVWTPEQRADLARWMESALPVQRTGQADDIAQAVVGLMTNSYVTGAVLTVDGGLHLN